ncbi:MAG: hypothetical protein COV55_01075 [Candidatus Komeilibacteria bacterium CG11_big_fil_rev_8_21_14_0_20_36_20]|uniref:Transposase IS200-like domain-containing protein n=1 Tax=Candidatus Komeilibacteria bacterium CG11_big_fil_rev_8_21_14_0_20_36_20 TaxID=1974477 RepID=A0A2H0NDM3_9BACT|nr:MAG: hypothetical protein COV55_01075 [Candidatus Komeilibacteria bacterium CG11_big_fil_rev_8_21_14_0_20_36_20]PIR81372.1 MAG: hypothetical protein COU21_04045 [Candidatus Komeilibacteria bacterium CG10_big_fil_rev_8_21_14_0_10_36_65]PJC55002.1 MAG: hypothetical protein CO027_04715 [Candidatus Komeilibacteria bacterium CG_4_9_14_0_2_um_filter_36_13]
MPNKPRNFFPNTIHHIYNRAVEKRTIFYTEQDYTYFLEKALFYKEKTHVKILAYCVMPNHWHFLLQEPDLTSKVESSAISRFISLLSNSYSKYFNIHKEHSGRIFAGSFKSKLVEDDNYLETVISYINLNPLKHKLTKNINDWLYSSHYDYIHRAKFKLVNQDYLVDFQEYTKNLDVYIRRLVEIDLEG